MRSLHLFKHGIGKGRTRKTAILILHNFFVFYYGYRCLEGYIKYLHDSNAVNGDAPV